MNSAEIKLLKEKEHTLILTSLCQYLTDLTDNRAIENQILHILSSYPELLEHFGINFTISSLAVLIASISEKLTSRQNLKAAEAAKS